MNSLKKEKFIVLCLPLAFLALLSVVSQFVSSAQAAEIVWVSFHGADDAPSAGAAAAGFTVAPDKGYTDLLTANGHNVVRYIQTSTPDPALLNAADLVIISRSSASSSFQNVAATTWNTTISAPMIILNGYTLRSNRMGYTTGTTMADITGNVTLTTTNPTHPIFEGIPLTGDTMTNPYAGVVVYPTDGVTLARGISINTDPVNADGTVLATISAAGNGPVGGMVIAEWPAGATLTHAVGPVTDTLAGSRLVFLTGSREASGISSETAGIYDLYADGAQMFLNAVNYMLSGGPPPIIIILSDTGWNKPVGDWDPATKTGTLTQDVTEAIMIISDGITLDGNGHTVTGTGTGNGVYASYRSSVTIKNLNVSKFFFGIYLRLCSNCTLSGNTASNNRYGIYLYGSGNNELKDNTCEYNTSFGIYLASSGSNTINNNNSSSNKAHGIYLSNSINNTITANTASNNTGYGIYLYVSSNNILNDNTCEYNTYFGISISSCSDNTLTNNTCISNASIGIYLSACSDNTLTNNTCNSNTNNGIYLSNSINNTITANTVSNNRHGIYLYVSSNNILNDNMCSSNARIGIYLLSASNDNVISGNTVLSNAVIGIHLYNSSGNQIYNNNFIDNTPQASVFGGSGNIFNLDKPIGGNFWSNWTGPDTDHDGFVDIPYVFTGGQDNLPWTKQDGWLNEPPVANAGDDLTVEATGPDGAVVTLDASDSTDPDSTPGTNDDIVSFHWYEGSTLIGSGETINYTFSLGTHTVTLVVTDSAGETSEDEVVITVQDTTPPTIYNILANPSVLWPPNHKMVEVTVTVDYDDICDPAPEVILESITMNEGDETNTYNPEFDTTIGDGHTTDDIQVDESGVIYLRAERSGTGTGRIYTLTYKAIDFAGNEATATVDVTVPHDQG